MVVETPIGSITLFNVHPHVPVLRRSRCGIGPIRLPIRFDAERRHRDVRRLVTLLDGADGPLLVLGDFNMSEHSADYRLVSTRLADAFVEVARGFGHTFPRVGALPRNLPVPWPMLRLDYVWHSPELRPRSARVGPSGGSDHHSVVVRLTRAR